MMGRVHVSKLYQSYTSTPDISLVRRGEGGGGRREWREAGGGGERGREGRRGEREYYYYKMEGYSILLCCMDCPC